MLHTPRRFTSDGMTDTARYKTLCGNFEAGVNEVDSQDGLQTGEAGSIPEKFQCNGRSGINVCVCAEKDRAGKKIKLQLTFIFIAQLRVSLKM